MHLPDSVNRIIHTLTEHGYEAYAVGGCVRDSLLSRSPQDWDITTSAKPDQVKALFAHTIDTGIEHGTVTVMIDHEGYETTTYRIDGEYEDSRHPKEVIFTSNLVEDLKRRDFTINAMAYNEETGLVDAFDGQGDLERGIIRCVGNPYDRFSEDALRMLRAVRFAAQLGFEIEEETRAAIKELAPTIKKVSAERIQVELIKMLTSPHPEEIRVAYELGLTAQFLPEFDLMMETMQNNKHHMYTVGEHSIQTMMQVRNDKVLRLTMLLHDVAKPLTITVDEEGQEHYYGHPEKGAEMAKVILRRLKWDNDTIDQVYRLIKYHDDRPAMTQKSVRKAMNRVGLEQFPRLFEVKRADILGQSPYQKEEKLAYVDQYQALYQEICDSDQCVSLKDMEVNGKDLLALGMKPGKGIGEALNMLFMRVLENPEENKREHLLEVAKKTFLLCALVLFTSLTGCGNQDEKYQGFTHYEKQSESAEQKLDTEKKSNGDYVLLLSIDTIEERVVVHDYKSNYNYEYHIGLNTRFLDKYGNDTSVSKFTEGAAVVLGSKDLDGNLTQLQLSNDVWVYDKVVRFDYDTEKSMIKIAGNKYSYDTDLMIFSNGKQTGLAAITEDDVLTIVGDEKKILSIDITTGHGSLSLSNTELFDGSYLQISNKMFIKISPALTLDLQEGTYTVAVANDGWGGSKEIEIVRGETTNLDLDEIKGEGPKYGNILFVVDNVDAVITVDGKQLEDITEPISLKYGKHRLMVAVDGYETWTRNLYVNSPEGMVEITLNSTTKDNSTEKKDGTESTEKSSESSQKTDNNSENTTSEKSEEDSLTDYLTTLSEMLSNIL